VSDRNLRTIAKLARDVETDPDLAGDLYREIAEFYVEAGDVAGSQVFERLSRRCEEIAREAQDDAFEEGRLAGWDACLAEHRDEFARVQVLADTALALESERATSNLRIARCTPVWDRSRQTDFFAAARDLLEAWGKRAAARAIDRLLRI